MILAEYDEERHIQSEKELARDEGLQLGLEQGTKRGIEAMIQDNLEEGIPRDRILVKLEKLFDLDRESALRYYEEYLAAAKKQTAKK